MLGDSLGDTSGDVSGDGRWLTYDELAKMRGITKASAERLVLRSRWRRRRDNQRVVRILVPLDRLSGDVSDDASEDISGDVLSDVSGISAAFETALEAISEAHAGEVSALRERAEVAERRADAADTDRRIAQARADHAESRAQEAEQCRDLANARADELQHDLDAARRWAQDAAQAADAMRHADAERRSRGRLARLRAAWRRE